MPSWSENCKTCQDCLQIVDLFCKNFILSASYTILQIGNFVVKLVCNFLFVCKLFDFSESRQIFNVCFFRLQTSNSLLRPQKLTEDAVSEIVWAESRKWKFLIKFWRVSTSFSTKNFTSSFPPLNCIKFRQKCSFNCWRIPTSFFNWIDDDKNQLSTNDNDVTILIVATQKFPLMAGEINFTLVVVRSFNDAWAIPVDKIFPSVSFKFLLTHLGCWITLV